MISARNQQDHTQHKQNNNGRDIQRDGAAFSEDSFAVSPSIGDPVVNEGDDANEPDPSNL
jgi:hypothetical protein